MEGAGLQRRYAFADERATAVDQSGLFGAIIESRARNGIVVGFVGLAEVSCIGVGEGSLLLHPVQSSGGVEPAREGNAYLLTDGQGLQNYGHDCGSSESF